MRLSRCDGRAERDGSTFHILIAVVREGRLHPPGLLARALTYGAKLLSDDDILEEARGAFQLAADAEAENRREALDDLRFARLGQQWPDKVRREREQEGRPCLTINRLPTFIRQVVNDARQNKGPHLLRSTPAPPGAHQAGGRRLRPGPH